MCGRYRLTRRRLAEIEQYYGIDDTAGLEVCERQFNIPPREMAPIVLGAKGRRRLMAGLWSLMPPWAEALEHVNKVSTFNAKAETLLQRPSFRNAFLKRRCLVPAEAFYEWVGPKGKKQPLNIARRDGKLLSMAGLFSFWKPASSKGRPLLTFTVVTITPNRWMSRIHDRMPVLLQDDEVDVWLNPAVSDPDRLGSFLKAPPEDFLESHAVDKNLLNSGLIDAPECAADTGVDYEPLLRTRA